MNFDCEPILGSIEEMRSQMAKLSDKAWQEGIMRLAPSRLRSSGTLKSGNTDSWIQANIYISEQVDQGRGVSMEGLLAINSILNPHLNREPIRDQEIFLGPWQACPVKDLQQSLEIFENTILPNEAGRHPLIHAALVQFHLVSLHPFWDGNGRTAVLAADWILATHGYLPQCFARQTDAVLAALKGREAQYSEERAVQKILKNIYYSYELCLGETFRSFQ